MNQQILFNLASRARPKRLFQTIEEIQSLCSSDNYTILVKIDIDDHNDYSKLLDYKNTDVKIGRSKNKVDAINRSIPKEGWNILVNVSDDIRFIQQGFDDIIRAHTGPDDFVLFPEPYADGQVIKGKNERISVMSVCGKTFYDRFGWVYHPSYSSVFCDNDMTACARILGRLKEVEIKIFYHEHPTAGYLVNDKQYCRTESFWDIDKQIFYQRKAINFGL